MKKITLALVLATSSLFGMAAFADSSSHCSIQLADYEMGAGKTFGPAEIAAIEKRGYKVETLGDQDYENITTLTTGSMCSSGLFGKKCKYSVQISHQNGGSMNLDYPLYGKSLKSALSQLPLCE